ncbi:hypothetical protein AB6A40_000188, partial [Gnathostoma spinigerum]
YAPTSKSEDEEVEEFYSELDTALQNKSTYTVLMGDFNAKVGRENDVETYIGRHGLGTRNIRGERLVTMAESNKLYIGNSWFKKAPTRKWTWITPSARKKNEIDYILVDKRRILKDVAIISSFDISSDHRLLRAKLEIIAEVEKRTLLPQNGRKLQQDVNETKLKEATERQDRKFEEDIEKDYAKLTSALERCIKEVEIKPETRRESRITLETRELMDARRRMKRTPHTIIKYTVLSKLIRRKLKETAAEKRKSLKKCRHSLVLYKTSIAAMKNEKGERVTVRKDIEELVKDFYTRLYSSKINITPPQLSNNTTTVPELLTSEVQFALSEMSKGKATGKDGISVEILEVGGLTLYRAIAQQFSHYLRRLKIPFIREESNTILLHKKGDTEDLKNYRQICLLDDLYKVFTIIIYNRLK